MPTWEESTHNGKVIREALESHPEGITKQDLVDLVHGDLHGVVNPNNSIATTIARAEDVEKAIVDGEERYFLTKYLPINSIPVTKDPEEVEKEARFIAPNRLKGRIKNGGKPSLDGKTAKVFAKPKHVPGFKKVICVTSQGNVPVPAWHNMLICIEEMPDDWNEDEVFYVPNVIEIQFFGEKTDKDPHTTIQIDESLFIIEDN